VGQKIVGKQVSYSLSLWESARVGARSVEKKEKERGFSLCSLIPHPNPLPKGEGVGRRYLALATTNFWCTARYHDY
jgi:hypothetical protein